jgi:hypothetical protein
MECGKPLFTHRNDVLGDDTCPECRHELAMAAQDIFDADDDMPFNPCSKCGCHCDGQADLCVDCIDSFLED